MFHFGKSLRMENVSFFVHLIGFYQVEYLLMVHSLVSSAVIWIPLVWAVKTDEKPHKEKHNPRAFKSTHYPPLCLDLHTVWEAIVWTHWSDATVNIGKTQDARAQSYIIQ